MFCELTKVIRQYDSDFESRFKLISSNYSSASFGDSVAIYERDGLEIRFSRDRGEFNCELRVAGNTQWVSIYRIFSHAPRSMRSEEELAALKFAIHVINDKLPEVLPQIKKND